MKGAKITKEAAESVINLFNLCRITQQFDISQLFVGFHNTQLPLY